MMKLLVAYSSIFLGFFFAFAIAFHGDSKFGHMIYRFNTIISMVMGEVDIEALDKQNKTSNITSPFNPEFWLQTDFSAHAMFFCFCCFVSVVVFNILTAFAIKVFISLLEATHHNDSRMSRNV